MTAKTVALVAISLIAAGFSGFGMAELIPNGESSDEIMDDFSEENVVLEFSQGEKLSIPSSSTQINP